MRPSIRSRRSRISPAALFVNVIARISFGRTPCARIRWATRWVSTRVLPEPAPAIDEQRPVDVEDRLALGRVEVGEELLVRCDGHGSMLAAAPAAGWTCPNGRSGPLRSSTGEPDARAVTTQHGVTSALRRPASDRVRGASWRGRPGIGGRGTTLSRWSGRERSTTSRQRQRCAGARGRTGSSPSTGCATPSRYGRRAPACAASRSSGRARSSAGRAPDGRGTRRTTRWASRASASIRRTSAAVSARRSRRRRISTSPSSACA